MNPQIMHLSAQCFFLGRSGTSRTNGTVKRASYLKKALSAKNTIAKQALLGLRGVVRGLW